MRVPIRILCLTVALLGGPAGSSAQDASNKDTSTKDAVGQKLFGTDCGLCHQRTGEGVPGQFPRLAGRLGTIAAKPEGRAYITHVLASGLSGAVTVDGHTIVGYMPAFRQVPATDVAAILTYVSGLGGTSPVAFTADKVAESRKTPMSPQAVHEERAKLVATKIVP